MAPRVRMNVPPPWTPTRCWDPSPRSGGAPLGWDPRRSALTWSLPRDGFKLRPSEDPED